MLFSAMSGLRRRGHLLRGLRTLVNDLEATPKQRLEACKMLFALETERGAAIAPKPRYSKKLRELFRKYPEPGLSDTSDTVTDR